ncbi:MAG: right-handed parallel beta-helix repeat-containing protein [Pirellulaceae bacterium]|nr:right-handed parallel beta-helix repeat-containing protein [Pirellulaceae bacterium]
MLRYVRCGAEAGLFSPILLPAGLGVRACAVCAMVLAGLLLAGTSGAKTLYVATDGDDAVAYGDNSRTRPWRTIGRAAWGSTERAAPVPREAAQAGDTVLVSAGIYWENGDREGGRFTVSLNPVNNGTAGNPITFRGEGLVYIRMNAGYRGGMIGSQGRDYIVWDHFQIEDYYGGSTSDTGPVVFNGSNHCQLLNCDVQGHPGSYYHGYATFGGNYRGISLEPANHTLIKNNRIHGFTGGQNEAGIMAYDSNHNIIENNEIYKNGQGVFIKGVRADWGFTQENNVIRYNLFRDGNGVRVLGSKNAKVYQNVFVNSHLWVGWSTSENTMIVNNTFDGSRPNDAQFTPQGNELLGVGVYNNIFADGHKVVYTWSGANPGQQGIRFDRNLYAGYTLFAELEDSFGQQTFEQWRARFKLDLNSLDDVDPRFVDAVNGDYRLQPDSPARTLGRDVLNLTGRGTDAVIPAGAYITGEEVIGVAGKPKSPAPSGAAAGQDR